MLIVGSRHEAIGPWDWVLIPRFYHFSLKFVFDRLSVPFVILSYVLSGTIGAFATKYMHRERGYNRFFVLYAVFLLGMVLTYVAAPVVAIIVPGVWRWAGVGAWALMALSFQPMLRLYRRSPAWGLALPVIGAFYTLFTVQSAIDVWRGRGGAWKGRAQALAG